MSRRARIGFAAVSLGAFGLLALAAFIAWTTSDTGPSSRAPATARLAPGAARPAVTDLTSVEQLQARFNADQGTPRLVLALAPT